MNKHQRGRCSLPYPPEAVFHPVQSQSWIAHLYIMGSQAQTVLSTSTICRLSGSGCCSSAGALSFALVVGHPLTSQKELRISQERIASSISMTCSLLVHHMFPSSNCHVHAQVVSSPGSQLMPSRHDLSGRIPVLASVLAGARGV